MDQKIVVWLLTYRGAHPIRLIKSKQKLARINSHHFTNSWLSKENEHAILAPSTLGFWKNG